MATAAQQARWRAMVARAGLCASCGRPRLDGLRRPGRGGYRLGPVGGRWPSRNSAYREADLTWFLRRVSKLPSCWIWVGAVSDSGYGWRTPPALVGLPRRMESAHRAAWRLLVGRIPEGKLVLHTCGVRLCVNPAHLYLGTQKDNVADAIAAGLHYSVRLKAGRPATLGDFD